MQISEFISRVREIGQFPDSDEDITDALILQEAYQGLLERFTQPIITLRNGSWLQKASFTLVPNQSRYRIPQRSIAQGLEKFELAMSSSGTSSQYRLMNVLTNIQSTDYEGLGVMGPPTAFTYVGDTIQIFPMPTVAWNAQLWYYLRPSVLAQSSPPTYVSNIITAANVVGSDLQLTLTNANAIPSSGFCDIQHSTGNCEMIAVDKAYTLISAGTIVQITGAGTDLDLVNQIVVGETAVTLQEQTDYIQIPQELQNALVSYTTAVLLATKGDAEKAQIFSQKAETAIKNIVDIALPRSKGQPSVFKTRNTYLRRRVGRWGWGGWGGV